MTSPERVTAAAVGERGAVATSHPLAARAALEMLDAGGTAADAAVAAGAVLCVVDPGSTGIGGDAFALYWPDGEPRPLALAAGGVAPVGLTVAALRAAGHDSMPLDGPWTVTVPGAVAGWEALLARCGRLGLERVLAPAIALAEDGFEVAPTIASEWARSAAKLARDAAAAAVFLPGGRPPAAGEHFANPELGAALRAIAAGGAAAFYSGDIAHRIDAAMRARGGPLRASDLAAWEGAEWVAPIATGFCGHEVFELPPPNQGIVVLEALATYAGTEPRGRVEREHVAIEALKLAAASAAAHVADPHRAAVPTAGLLDPDYIARRRRLIDPERAAAAAPGRPGDTVYVAVATRDAGSCSFIQSVYEGFGSGVGVPGVGITLHNRGAGFTLDEHHSNCPAPGKRPFHTLIPAMLGAAGRPVACFGVIGGYMQPQGHLQLLRALLERDEDPQAAVAAPRWRALGGRRLGLEPGFDPELADGLAQRGHELEPLPSSAAGGGQVVIRRGNRYAAGSDPRKDGGAFGW